MEKDRVIYIYMKMKNRMTSVCASILLSMQAITSVEIYSILVI